MFQIDIGKIIQEKLGKKLPRFLVRALEKLIHQDEMNEFLATDGRDKVGLEFVEASLRFLDIKIKIIGEENLTTNDGSLCFVSNHPLGGIDGLTLIKVIGDKYDGNVKVLLNSFLAELPGLAPFSVPVNVAGGTSKGATFNETSSILLRLGATEAIMLDGGSSSSLVIKGKQISKTFPLCQVCKFLK